MLMVEYLLNYLYYSWIVAQLSRAYNFFPYLLNILLASWQSNKNVKKTNICSILDAKNGVGYGTENEHEITEEEKLATIDYLKHHHLVSKNGIVDSKVYNLAINRYLAGTLFTEEEKDKIKNKS